MSKSSSEFRPQHSEPTEDGQPGKTRHSNRNSASEAPAVLYNATAPAANAASSARVPSATNTAAPNADVTSGVEPGRAAESRDGSQSTAATVAGPTLSTVPIGQQAANAPLAAPIVGSATSSSDNLAVRNSGKELGCQMLHANSGASASTPAFTKAQTDLNAADACDADPPKATGTPKSLESSASQQESEAAGAPAANMQTNRPAQDAQTSNAPAADAARADSIQASLPAGATLISITADENTTPSPETSSQNRADIAQRLQPALPNLVGVAPANTGQPVQPPAPSNGDPAADGNKSDGSSSQSGGHSMAQTPSSASSHAADDSKSSGAAGLSQATAQQGNGQAAGPQGPSNVNSTSATTTATLATQTAHIAAHAAAQPNASGDSSAAAKSSPNTAPGGSQLSSFAASAATSLPRSLNDVNQAAQLYQRMGNAEMHISMDADALGPIDLRAVVHQGSLSATIAVQRADVQTLLVNELPSLQHSLAEKNFQVNQISVLAGSIGSGAHQDSQPHDQQNRGQSTPLATPVFQDDPPGTLLSRAHISQIAGLTVNSARLSVIA